MRLYRTVLSIAGSDSGGGAGIQADIKTISALGVYATTAITAVTAQNTCGVSSIEPVSPLLVKAQIEAVLSDIGADAIKIGMLHNMATAKAVSEAIVQYNPQYVILDPVMISTSGHKLIEDETIDFIRNTLMKQASLITPNIDEAALLAQCEIQSEKEVYTAAEKLLNTGCQAVLMKGGHLKGETMTDILFTKNKNPLVLKEKHITSQNTHGTGCTLSSAIASYLALGQQLEDAVIAAKRYITQAIEAGSVVTVGKGHGPLNHFFTPTPLHITSEHLT